MCSFACVCKAMDFKASQWDRVSDKKSFAKLSAFRKHMRSFLSPHVRKVPNSITLLSLLIEQSKNDSFSADPNQTLEFARTVNTRRSGKTQKSTVEGMLNSMRLSFRRISLMATPTRFC